MQPHTLHSALSPMMQHRSPDQRPRQQSHYVEPSIAGPSSAPPPVVYRMPRLNQSLNPSSPAPVRKKGGRGPGKRDNKEKPIVSVRWEEGDLTDRLISALEMHDRWANVFTNASSSEHARSMIGVPKRDLQREIARHLFQGDPRYDLDDKRTVEALAVSVKNKLFKIQTLFIECKNDLGPAYQNMKDEDDITPHSELAHAWARIKEKLPQFFRVRDIMNRPLPMLGQTEEMPLAESSAAGAARHASEHRTNSRSVTSGASGLNIETGVPTTYPTSPIGLSPIASIGSARGQPRYYPPPVPPPVPRTQYINAFPGAPHELHRTPAPMTPTPLHHTQSIHQDMETIPYDSRERISSEDPYHDPSPPRRYVSASESPSPPPPPPSPPLSQTMISLLTSLDSRKRTREDQYLSLKRLKIEQRERDKQREDRERERWHEREVLRLKIRLERAKRGEDLGLDLDLGGDGGDGNGGRDPDASPGPGPGPSGDVGHHHSQHHPGTSVVTGYGMGEGTSSAEVGPRHGGE